MQSCLVEHNAKIYWQELKKKTQQCFVYGVCPGVPWRLHTWLQSLSRAQHLGRDDVLVRLLTEFSSIRTEDYGPELLSSGIPLMFSMLESSKVRFTVSDVVVMMCSCSCSAETLSSKKIFLVTLLCLNLQDYVITKRLASVLAHCYGSSPVTPVPTLDMTMSTQLGNVDGVDVIVNKIRSQADHLHLFLFLFSFVQMFTFSTTPTCLM